MACVKSASVIFSSLKSFYFNRVYQTSLRLINTSAVLQTQEESADPNLEADEGRPNKPEGMRGHLRPDFDVETSIEYLKSKAYKETYQNKVVWYYYRRNFRGHFMPDTRKTCVRAGVVTTGSPCPICRDDYLVMDYKNVDLIKQFLDPVSGTPLPTKTTGICQRQHNNLTVALAKAVDRGLIEEHLEHRVYDYDYYREVAKEIAAREESAR